MCVLCVCTPLDNICKQGGKLGLEVLLKVNLLKGEPVRQNVCVACHLNILGNTFSGAKVRLCRRHKVRLCCQSANKHQRTERIQSVANTEEGQSLIIAAFSTRFPPHTPHSFHLYCMDVSEFNIGEREQNISLIFKEVAELRGV